MLSKKTIKLFHSLQLKKYRTHHGLFVAEGAKTICDLLQADAQLELLIVERGSKDTILFADFPHETISSAEIKKISKLKTPPSAIALFQIPQTELNIANIEKKLSLFCDQIQDPGNLGTIIRTASWFDIKHIFCAHGTVDAYNPKTIQASMGAIAQVEISYVESQNFFSMLSPDFPIYGTFLSGNNIYKQELSPRGIIVIGNEGSGITSLTESYVNNRISIPSFSPPRFSPESLNASAAAAVVCAEFCRQISAKNTNY